MPPRVPALLCATLALVGGAASAGGCGRSDEERVAETLRRFEDATRRHDWRTLCEDVLAGRILARMRRIGLPCEEALERGLGSRRRPSLRIERIRVRDDDVALAQVRTSALGERPARVTLELVREDGDWRLASLSGAQPPAPRRELR